MKNKKKTLLMSLAAVLLVVSGVFGTLAFLSGTTNEVTNTFTAGNVSFEDDKGLDEADVDEYGTPIEGAERVLANDYTLIPGHNYTKDPTVHIQSGSEPALVYVKVTNPIAEIEGTPSIESQILENWTKVNGYSDLYKYKTEVDAKEKSQSLEVFKEFTLKNEAKVSEYNDKQITVKAFAIQSTNLGETNPDIAAAEALGATTP